MLLPNDLFGVKPPALAPSAPAKEAVQGRIKIVGLVPLCLTRRSVVRLLDLAELHRSGSVDADAALDAASRTPVLGVVVRQWGRQRPCRRDGSGGGGLIPSLAARFRIGLGFLCRWVWRLRSTS